MWSNSTNECGIWNAAFPHWRASQRVRGLPLPHLPLLHLPTLRGLNRLPRELARASRRRTLSAGVLPVFGKAVLAIAGAYLLRAVAESGTLPKLPVLVVAMLYAGMWLVWAARTHATNHFASVTYAITAALILSPLLWESTVRFQVLLPVFTAAVLVAFVVLALALAWRQEPAGDSVGSNSGGGGHGSRTDHRNARPGAVYGWIAGYRPGYRGDGLPGTPTHGESGPGDCSGFCRVVARLSDDFSGGRSGRNISP